MTDTSGCPPRTRPNFQNTPEIAEQVAASARIAPLYEAGLYKYVIRRHYSLKRNANLICAWEKYKDSLADRKPEPFVFPNIRDLHFHNGMIRFLPSETVYTKPSFRKSLKPGPGVDYGGQMPIPQESMMKRLSSIKGEKTGKKIKKVKDGKTKKFDKPQEDKKIENKTDVIKNIS